MEFGANCISAPGAASARAGDGRNQGKPPAVLLAARSAAEIKRRNQRGPPLPYNTAAWKRGELHAQASTTRRIAFVGQEPARTHFQTSLYRLAITAFIGMMTLCIISNRGQKCDSPFPIQFRIKAASAD